MTLDLVVINPGGGSVIYQQLDEEFTAAEPPLWCRLIAGYCIYRGHEVRIVDYGVGQLDYSPGRVYDTEPLLFCIAAYGHQPNASTQSMEDATRIATDLKKQYPSVPIIMVGGHVAALPEKTLQETDTDYVALGEGVVTVERLLCAIKYGTGLTSVPGLVSNTVINQAPPLLDPCELHGDTWHLLQMDRYRAHNWQCLDGSSRSPYASIYTTLGCPYSCSFCCINAPFGGPSYRRRNPDEVIREVDHLYRRYGVLTLKIIDEMFVLNEKHYGPICEGLAALPFANDLNIWAYARVDTVKPDNLALLRSAGIRWLALGIESGSAHVRDGANKSFGEDDIRSIVRMIQESGINVIGNFIFGLPDDTLESMTDTLMLATELNCEFANFYSAMAYPGSRLFEEADVADLPEKWSGYSQHSADTKPLPNANLTSKQIVSFRDVAFDHYYSNKNYLTMVWQKFGISALKHIVRMSAQKLGRTG